ncbi:MAG: septum formation initiator family protein [Bacteroidales bacterium]|nr:septum formation initiator family protein [Bacteroidales bacterium]
MKVIKKILSVFINKYVIAVVVFLSWIGIFDKNNLIFQYKLKSELNQLQKDKKYYSDEIRKSKEEIEGLTKNNKILEKFAREKYLMKKENEEIFVIVKQKKDSVK